MSDRSPDRSNELAAWDRDHFFHPSTHMGMHARGETPTRVIGGGQGVYITDVNGKTSLDAFAGPNGAPVWYQKHMAHHMVGPIAHDDLPGLTHAFLIRDPARVVASYAAKRVAVRPEHLGCERQVEYFEREADRLGHAPPVVDSADIVRDPPAMLRKLCAALGLDWDDAMLSWEPGIRDTDGIWASHWYDAVAASTGFGEPDERPILLDDNARRVADACRPFYERLAAHRLTR